MITQDAKTETIRLEFLRPGAPWGQLLSPLTQYIAICGDDPPETVTIPFDQRSLMERLSRLNYDHGEPASPGALREAAEIARRVLESVRGFRSMLANAAKEASIVHVRLVLTAAELAMIPFELAYAPLDMNGFPTVTLNSSARVVITRETRHERIKDFEWPCCPKILFVVAAPDGTDVPETAHYAALRRAIEPLLPARASIEAERKYIRWLRKATLRDIERACADEAFTHVHILAHGVVQSAQRRADDGSNYGIFLESITDPRGEVVSADRLALALLRGPKVVSLAVCDSGNVGLSSVLGTGASIAHRLHDGEIPFVVASQFPMTFLGSAVMTETLYTGLLRGQDPREVAWETRRKLFERVPDTHDWASLTVYADLPAAIGEQAQESVRTFQRMSIDQQMLHIEWFDQPLHNERRGTLPEDPEWTPQAIDAATERRIAAVRDKTDHLLEQARLAVEAGEFAPAREQLGLLASVYKRLGVLYDVCDRVKNKRSPNATTNKLCARAKENYLLALSAYQLLGARNNALWVATQLSMLNHALSLKSERPPSPREEIVALFDFAKARSILTLVHPASSPDIYLDDIAQAIELQLLGLRHLNTTDRSPDSPQAIESLEGVDTSRLENPSQQERPTFEQSTFQSVIYRAKQSTDIRDYARARIVRELSNLWGKYIEVFTRPAFKRAPWFGHLHARNWRRVALWLDDDQVRETVEKYVTELEERGVKLHHYALTTCDCRRSRR